MFTGKYCGSSCYVLKVERGSSRLCSLPVKCNKTTSHVISAQVTNCRFYCCATPVSPEFVIYLLYSASFKITEYAYGFFALRKKDSYPMYNYALKTGTCQTNDVPLLFKIWLKMWPFFSERRWKYVCGIIQAHLYDIGIFTWRIFFQADSIFYAPCKSDSKLNLVLSVKGFLWIWVIL